MVFGLVVVGTSIGNQIRGATVGSGGLSAFRDQRWRPLEREHGRGERAGFKARSVIMEAETIATVAALNDCEV
jgi:hypothetical protein